MFMMLRFCDFNTESLHREYARLVMEGVLQKEAEDHENRDQGNQTNSGDIFSDSDPQSESDVDEDTSVTEGGSYKARRWRKWFRHGNSGSRRKKVKLLN